MVNDAYAAALERLQRFRERDTERIGRHGRTLVFDHGRPTARVTLLFHGLSAAPLQLLAVAESLHQRGHNVIVPRLPRHGHRDRLSHALATLDSRQLKACALEALAIADGMGERVHVAGFSLGGLLSCYLAQTQHVHRAVAVSPFLGVGFLPASLRSMAIRVALALPNRFYWWDPILRERQQPEHGYPRYATHALAHGLSLAHELFDLARAQPPRADHVTLVMNTRDFAVNNRAIRRLARYWASSKPDALETLPLRGLPFVHDIVEPKRHPEIARRVNALLTQLIDR